MLITGLQNYEYLLISILLGAIFGLENEYRMQHGAKIYFGLRTSIFVAMLGYIFADLYYLFSSVSIIITGFAIMTVIVTASYLVKSFKKDLLGMTTYVSSLILFTAGILTGLGYYEFAIILTILITAISFYKRELLNFIHLIKRSELIAAINLMIIALVILPILPNHNIGPYDFFNPFQFWLIVTVVGMVFFVQYLILRARKRSFFLSSIVGSMISGTTITFSLLNLGNRVRRLSKQVVYNSIFSANIVMILVQVLFIIYIATRSTALMIDLLPVSVISLGSMMVVFLIGRKNLNTTNQKPSTPFPLVKSLEFAAVFFVIISVGKIIAAVAPGLLPADVFVSSLANVIGTMFTIGTLTTHNVVNANYAAFLVGLSIAAGVIEKGFIGLISKSKYVRNRMFVYSIVIGLLILLTSYIQFYGI